MLGWKEYEEATLEELMGGLIQVWESINPSAWETAPWAITSHSWVHQRWELLAVIERWRQTELRQTKPGADAANGSQIKQENFVQRLQDQDAFVESNLLTDSHTVSVFCVVFPSAGIFGSLEYPCSHGCPFIFQPLLPHPFLYSLCSTESSRLFYPAFCLHKIFRNLII